MTRLLVASGLAGVLLVCAGVWVALAPMPPDVARPNPGPGKLWVEAARRCDRSGGIWHYGGDGLGGHWGRCEARP